jgi:hypothetical protein
MHDRKKLQNGCLAAAAVTVGLVALPGGASADQCLPTGPGDRSPSFVGVPGYWNVNSWGETALSDCSHFGFRDIGRKH